VTRVSVWAYPWDLGDLGLDAALGRLAEAGANCVSLATSYHAGRFVQPGNPRRRVYFPQDGTVYYRLDPRRWEGAGIRALQADSVATDGDMLGGLIDRRGGGGPAVSCWTVCLHNTRLGMLHPGDVVRTAFGDPLWHTLCPSSPAARDYVARLCREIAEVYQPDRIELESPDFMGFDHGFHHEKDGLPLRPEDSFLMGLCFCDHCAAAAARAGVPFAEAKGVARTRLEAAFAAELPPPPDPAFGPGWAAASPALAAFLDWRKGQVAGLLAEVRAAVPPVTELVLIDFPGSWVGGVDLTRCARHVDGVLFCGYVAAPAALPGLLAPVRDVIGDKTLIAGFQLFHPNVRDRQDLAARVAAAAPSVDGFNFYNLGLVPPARLRWIAQALSAR
jgi:hypothetical protein